MARPPRVQIIRRPRTDGTVTFTLLSGSTTVGSPVTANVSGALATATYVLPAATPIGTYTIQAAYNGTTTYSGSSDSSHTLTVTANGAATLAANDAYELSGGGFLSDSQKEDLTTATFSLGTAAGIAGTLAAATGVVDATNAAHAAEEAVKRAQARLAEGDLGSEEVAAVQAALQKSLAQLHVKRRRH